MRRSLRYKGRHCRKEKQEEARQHSNLQVNVQSKWRSLQGTAWQEEAYRGAAGFAQKQSPFYLYLRFQLEPRNSYQRGDRLSGRCCARWFPSDSAVIKDDKVNSSITPSFWARLLLRFDIYKTQSLTDLMICPRSHDNLLIIGPLPFYHLISLRWFMYNEKNYKEKL